MRRLLLRAPRIAKEAMFSVVGRPNASHEGIWCRAMTNTWKYVFARGKKWTNAHVKRIRFLRHNAPHFHKQMRRFKYYSHDDQLYITGWILCSLRAADLAIRCVIQFDDYVDKSFDHSVGDHYHLRPAWGQNMFKSTIAIYIHQMRKIFWMCSIVFTTSAGYLKWCLPCIQSTLVIRIYMHVTIQICTLYKYYEFEMYYILYRTYHNVYTIYTHIYDNVDMRKRHGW